MGPHPAVAQVRLAVRRALAGTGRGELVLAACSGGADSLALAAALAFEGPRLGVRAGAVTVDHGLQPGSAQRAAELAGRLAGLGLDPVLSLPVTVAARGPARDGQPAAYPGPEAAARQARYAALERAADQAGAAAVLLGHTLDDQAETVLLGLARGSGARSLAGMPAAAGCWLRPLLGIRRAQTRAACTALDLPWWDDPHNDDPRFTRSRIRGQVMPVLARVLGPGVPEALARTAAALAADVQALDAIAAAEAARITAPDGSLPADELGKLPAAIRTRVLRAAAVAAGAPPGALGSRHVAAMDALVTGWRGQLGADLPGGIVCRRRYGRLAFSAR
jgi:tRNA(Ile)-lysidine synthase